MKRLLMVSVFLVFLALPGVVHPAGRVTEEGRLTGIEGGEIIIDGRGYALSPRAVIIDGRNRKITPGRLRIPGRVVFEYTYTRNGPVIIKIMEIPDVLPE